MKLLLVDDEVVALHALKKRVDWLKYGFTEVLTAQDAACAKALFEKHVIDLVLCDIEMPGESGLRLVAFVKEAYPQTECIMVTCHAEFSYIKEAMQYRVCDYILKPIDYAELEHRLMEFVRAKEAAQQKEQLTKIVDKAQETREKAEPTDGEQDRVESVKQYIEAHLQERMYIEDLARLVHLNDRHLMRVFKRETGLSLLEYITERRIMTAGKLLRTTDHSINFIADCVGCENGSYFTKLFKKYTGLTPSEYRKMGETAQ